MDKLRFCLQRFAHIPWNSDVDVSEGWCLGDALQENSRL